MDNDSRSIISLLPRVVSEGRREANKILEGLSAQNRIFLQTNELVIPSKDSNYRGLIEEIERKEKIASTQNADWMNRLIYGDNLLAVQALLAGDDATPSLRGKVDLIYIDPPFDSKADYRTKIELPGFNIEQKPTVIEQFAYADTWSAQLGGEQVRGTLAYLRYMYPRLVLMRELLSEKGSLYVHIDWHIGHYMKVILDDIFGKENFRNEIIWKRTTSRGGSNYYNHIHDSIFFYSKDKPAWNQLYTQYRDDYIDQMFRGVGENGKKYRESPLTAPGISNGESGVEWKGYSPSRTGKGRHWAIPGFIRGKLSDIAQSSTIKALESWTLSAVFHGQKMESLISFST